jgi:pilus assembly protein Flp/PilA
MKQLVGRLVREEDAQDLIEYALLTALVALAVTVALTNLGTGISELYGRVTTKLSDAVPAAAGGGGGTTP